MEYLIHLYPRISEEVGEVAAVQLGEALAVVDGLADHEHGGERQVIVVDDPGQVFQLSPVDALVGPCQVVAGGYGCILRVFFHELPLHIIHDGC